MRQPAPGLSLRWRRACHLELLRAAQQLALCGVGLRIADPLDRLPHFNPDLDVPPVPATIEHWRAEIAVVDAVLLCSPEVALGVPGVLKNAHHWLVPSGELYENPPA